MNRLLTIIVLLSACGNITPSGDMTSVGTPTAGGLTGGSNTGSANLSIKSCDVGGSEILEWDGNSWECIATPSGGGAGDIEGVTAGNGLTGGGTTGTVTLDVDPGTGISVVGDEVTLNMTAQNCSAGSFLDEVTAVGVFTCVAEVGDISSVVAGSGLITGGTSGAVTVDVQTGTGITISGDAVTLNMAGASCGNNAYMSALGATGTGTCASLDLTVTNSSTGSLNVARAFDAPVVDFTGAGAVTVVGIAPPSTGGNQTIRLINNTGNALTLAHESGSATSAAYRVVTSSAGNATVPSEGTALLVYSTTDSRWHYTTDASGGGSVIDGSGTTSYVARWSDSDTLTIGQIFDNNSDEVKVGNGADAGLDSNTRLMVTMNGDTAFEVRDSTNDRGFVVSTGTNISIGTNTNHNLIIRRNGTAKIQIGGGVSNIDLLDNTSVTGNLATTNGYISAAGSSGWLIAAQAVYAGAGAGYITASGTYGCALNTNATATCIFNGVGYSEGTTQFRNFKLQDGKGADIIDVVGSTKIVTFAGAVTTTGLLTATAGATTPADLTTTGTGDLVSGDGLTVANNAVFGDAVTDSNLTRATLGFLGTDPTVSSGNCTVAGEAQTFTITSNGDMTTCVIDLNRTITGNRCTFSATTSVAAASVAAPGMFITQSTTQVTLQHVGGGNTATANSWNVHCFGDYD